MIYGTEQKEELSPSLCDARHEPLLDYHRLHRHRMVLSRYRTHRNHLYDWSRAHLHLARPLLVWQCLSARQSIRPTAVEVLTPQANTSVCAYLRLPPVYGVLHLRYVRHPTDIHRSLERGRLGYVERNWSRFLDDYRSDHHRWHYPVVYLCASHMVFVLPDGNHLVMGGSKAPAITQALHCCACCSHLPDERQEQREPSSSLEWPSRVWRRQSQVQELRSCLPHAAYALRQPRSGVRLSASRLPEVRQMHLGLSYKDYVVEEIGWPRRSANELLSVHKQSVTISLNA